MEQLMDRAQMRRLDQETIETYGIPSMVLMERAALAVAEEMEARHLVSGRVLVVCGSGNNGGDGFALARILQERGAQAEAVFVGRDPSMTAECRMQRQICENCKVKVSSKFEPAEYTTIVDALLGIGLSRAVEGRYREAVGWMNRQRAVRVSIDIPSGVSADTGEILGDAVQADLTVTFACKKPGQLRYPGAAYCGELVCRAIGMRVPAFGTPGASNRFTFGREDLERLPARKPGAHKGTFGKVLLVAGSKGMSGAACLGARAAYRTGCGLVRVFTPECNRQVLQTVVPEAVVETYEDEAEGTEQLFCAMAWADVMGIGPGLGTSPGAKRLLEAALNFQGPLVLDADALNLLSADPSLWEKRTATEATVITPHLGELARLTGQNSRALSGTLLAVCEQFAKSHGVICVGKDARTVVTDGVRTYLNTSGNSGMATGGAGDVLTGVLLGLLAQGMQPLEAACLGVYVHGLAGDCARETHGEYSMMAGDLTEGIEKVLSRRWKEI